MLMFQFILGIQQKAKSYVGDGGLVVSISTLKVQKIQYLSFDYSLFENSTLISRENCRVSLGEKLVKMLWFWSF